MNMRLPFYLIVAICFALNGHPAESHETVTKNDAAVVGMAESSHAKMRGVDLNDVAWTDGFWADRCGQASDVTLRKLWELLADPEEGHVLDNMRLAAGLVDQLSPESPGEFAGTDWQDAWLYKWIEAAACAYSETNEPWIKQRMDEAIELITAAQEEDGYIGTQVTARGAERFQDPRVHEVYSMGHLLTAACVHYRMTGEETLLDVAVKNADFLCETLGVSVPPCFAHNPSAVMGMVELYRVTGEQKYLDCAKMIVDRRGESPKPGGLFYQGPGIMGTDLIQDRVPIRRETHVVGHNVFFTYLYAGATDICLETGDQTLQTPLERLWRDLTEQKMCINGGVSPMGHGLTIRSDPVCEAVGTPYFLPCADCYNETCGQIGNFMWNYRMLCLTGDAKYADIMELELYNGFLAGVGLDGESWFYRNSLRRYDSEHVESGHNDLAERVMPGRKRICCPTNLLRTLVELKGYMYGVDDLGILVHHYGSSTLETTLADGRQVRIDQTTDYPWDGDVELEIEDVEGDESFVIRMRIPGWAESASASINGYEIMQELTPGKYMYLNRAWKVGDVVQLHIPINARLMEAHPQAEQLRNQAAVMRGPILYCAESVDQAKNVELNNVYLPTDVEFAPTLASDFPFNLTVLEGVGLHRPTTSWEGQLYRSYEPSPLSPIPVRLIPYFAWANRSPTAMTVWMPIILKE